MITAVLLEESGLVQGICDCLVGFGELGFMGETDVCDNGRFAYVKLTGAGNL